MVARDDAFLLEKDAAALSAILRSSHGPLSPSANRRRRLYIAKRQRKLNLVSLSHVRRITPQQVPHTSGACRLCAWDYGDRALNPQPPVISHPHYFPTRAAPANLAALFLSLNIRTARIACPARAGRSFKLRRRMCFINQTPPAASGFGATPVSALRHLSRVPPRAAPHPLSTLIASATRASSSSRGSPGGIGAP